MTDTDAVLVPAGAALIDVLGLAADVDGAAALAERALSPGTLAAYAAAWDRFDRWATARGLDPAAVAAADEVTVARALQAWIGWLVEQGYGRSTIRLSLAGVAHHLRHVHGRADHPHRHPEVERVVAGMVRSTAAAKGARAVTEADLVRLVAVLGDRHIDRRDRAIVSLLFHSACRRSELAALTLADVEDAGDRMRLHIARSKTDQSGEGRPVSVRQRHDPALCPVRATRSWLDVRGSDDGPLFVGVAKGGRLTGVALVGTDIDRIVKRAAKAAGLEGVSPHGFRAGHVTEARRRGAKAHEIRLSTGHTDTRMIDRYTRGQDADEGSGRYFV